MYKFKENFCIRCKQIHYVQDKNETNIIKYKNYVCTELFISNKMSWLMHLNIQGGLSSKIEELQLLLENSNIDIVCFNEHHLVDTSMFIFNTIPNYHLATYYCRDVKWGGSCILLKDGLEYIVRSDLCVFNEVNVFEASCLEITPLQMIVISLYRIPDDSNFKTFINKLDSLISIIQKEFRNKQLYIAADFNVDLLNNVASSKKKFQRNEFLNLLELYGLKVCFHEPTRVSTNTVSCIDNILIKSTYTDEQPKLMNLELGLSDHRALFISLNTNSKYHALKAGFKKRIFSNTNMCLFTKSLSDTTWPVNNILGCEQNFKEFLGHFLSIFNSCFPLKFFSNKSKNNNLKNNWITKGIRVSSANKRILHRIYKQTNDPEFISYYRTYNKIFKSVCKLSKKLANGKFIKEADNRIKAAWMVVNSGMGVKRNIPNISDLVIGQESVSEGQTIAGFFNNLFVNISETIHVKPNKDKALNFVHNMNCGSSAFNFQEVSAETVKRIIISLHSKKSAGWDEIPLNIVKRVANHISDPISTIINQSFIEGIFPHQLKFADVKPLFKKGDKNNPANYRPVAILPAFSKIFEKIAYRQIEHFFEINGIFTNNQFGFRMGQNTISAISSFINQVTQSLDSSECTAAIFCDLAKAFECINHEILLDKLKFYNFSDKAILWLKSYLSDRFQRTIIMKNGNKFFSNWKKLISGVPQGSIIGPLLFLIYINDLPHSISSSLILYADDTTSIIKAKTNDDLMVTINQNLKQLSFWFQVNGLQLNSKKTQIMKLCTAQSRDHTNKNIIIQGEETTFTNTSNFLGLTIDNNLTWKPYLDKLIKKLNRCCYQMIMLRDVVDLNTRVMVYYAFFYSVLQYGIEFWGSTNINKIFKVQKRILRIMIFADRRTSCKRIFRDLNLLTVPCLYIFKCLMFVKVKLNTILEEQHHHPYFTRHKNDLLYPRHRLVLFEQTNVYMGKKMFNKLPNTLKTIEKTEHFKCAIKEFLINKVYYSVNEYLNDNNL